MLTGEELDLVISGARCSVFRLETLDAYAVPAESSEFRSYLQGGPPDRAAWQPWLDYLRTEGSRGVWRHKVHVLTTPLSDYLRYECEWGYAVTTTETPEEVRILDLAERPHEQELAVVDHDFWLVDGERVVRMHYADDATFLGAELLGPEATPRYRAARDAAWRLGVDFGPWWAERPEYHRDHRAA